MEGGRGDFRFEPDTSDLQMSFKSKGFIIGGLLLGIIVLILLCTPRSSSGLSEEKFVEVYVNLSIAKEMFAADSLKLEVERKKIFEQTGVTRDEIVSFVNRLSQKPQQWDRVWKMIVEKLEERRQQLN
jgi:hypothetical protein